MDSAVGTAGAPCRPSITPVFVGHEGDDEEQCHRRAGDASRFRLPRFNVCSYEKGDGGQEKHSRRSEYNNIERWKGWLVHPSADSVRSNWETIEKWRRTQKEVRQR